MQKSKIEWTDYTVNPVKGLCPMACPYCYARAMYKRFLWDGTIAFEPAKTIKALDKTEPHSKIFVGSTMELFGDWIPSAAQRWIFQSIPKIYNDRTFIFLTKQPQNLQKWSPFPDNAWVGVSCTNSKMLYDSWGYLEDVKAKVKFYSFEPLLERIDPANVEPEEDDFVHMLTLAGINWIIIGQQTPAKAATTPKLEWIKEIVEAADKAGVPVFLKNNLDSLLGQNSAYKKWKGTDKDGNNLYGLRQELPCAILENCGGVQKDSPILQG